jgi:hypothetical protein
MVRLRVAVAHRGGRIFANACNNLTYNFTDNFTRNNT